MIQEEIKKKAQEIAKENGREYRDQEYGDINTEEKCYDSAIEMAEYVIAETDIDEKHKIGKWFTGLIPCWVDAPSTLQAAHDHHGKNIVAIHLKNGGYRCCCVDDKKPTTFSLAEGTPLVEGWHNKESFLKNGIKNNSDIALVQQAVDKARDLANTIEGALAGEEPFPATYYRMCQDIIECLTKINKIV